MAMRPDAGWALRLDNATWHNMSIMLAAMWREYDQEPGTLPQARMLMDVNDLHMNTAS